MNILSRRGFIGGAAAAFGGLVLPADAFGTSGKPLLKLGVISDIHIGFGGIGPSKDLFLKELRWLGSQGVEAVIFPGDMADHGLISELEALADVWQTVFPNGCAADGRKVHGIDSGLNLLDALGSGKHDAVRAQIEALARGPLHLLLPHTLQMYTYNSQCA
mgnify:CR=1 FL=1